MSDSIPTLDMQSVRESSDLECKKAAGKDGKGALPVDFWETYSAMANTDGGVVLLGMQQQGDRFIPHGIERPDKVLKELFDTANNRSKVSFNLLTNDSARLVRAEGKILIAVTIPRASRQQQPVFLNGNPLGNTFIRLHEGDLRLSDDAVKRMLAEQSEDSRDTKILSGYDLADLSVETLRVYRQVFSNRQPRHPWNELELHPFLRQIGAWRKDRESGVEGLTAAGLLMFGTHPVIQEAFPFYMLDYQERPEAKTEKRWIDRVTLDGTWSGKGMHIPGPEDVFGSSPQPASSIEIDQSSIDLPDSSIGLPDNSIDLGGRNESGMLISGDFDKPFIDDLQRLTNTFRKSMEHLAAVPRQKRKLKKEKMESVISELCRGHYIKLGCIAELVDRNPVSLRSEYLNPMKKAGVLKIAFPRTPNDPRQAYTLNDKESEAKV